VRRGIMKKFGFIVVFSLIALLITAMPVMAAPPVDNPGKGPLDKIIFVHYPKHDEGKPGGSSSSGAASTSCADYKYSGVKWATNQVSYCVNPVGSGVDYNAAVLALQRSFETWNGAGSSLRFNINLGVTAEIAGDQDGVNAISWVDISKSFPGAIAVTYIWYPRNTRIIYEVDTLMALNLPWAYTAPGTLESGTYPDPTNSGTTGKYDIQNIMTHEAGHWVMLGDLYNNKDSLLTMYGYGKTGEICKDTLGWGDLLGVRQAYP
jgi:hypothetical protein